MSVGGLLSINQRRKIVAYKWCYNDYCTYTINKTR